MPGPFLLQIRASAGSGKTTRLTADYIARLKCLGPRAQAAHSAGILAVTFTNAAAAEMRSRVISYLKKQALAGGDGADWAARWLDIFFSEPHGLNIRTIDSLLHQIVRASALELGISPDYETSFDIGKTLEPHVDLMLEAARKPGPARDRLRRACLAVLELKDGKGFLSGKSILEPITKALASALTDKFGSLSDTRVIESALAALDENLAGAACRLLDLAAEKGLAWNTREKNAVARVSRKDFQKSWPAFLKKDPLSGLFKAVPEEHAAAICAAFQDLKQKCADWFDGREILERGRREKPFIDLALDVANSYKADSLQNGIVLNALAPGWASRVLGLPRGVSEALLRLGARLSHFLVDEFQDTSSEQWQVLRALVHEAISYGGSCTWVGDVKQSIYGWRGGNPALFEAPATDSALTAVAGMSSESLGSNYRSLPAIVEHNNRLFEELSKNAADIARSLIGSNAPEDIIQDAAQRIADAYGDARQICARSGEQGFVWTEAIPGEKAEGKRAAIAEKLCQILLDDIGRRRPWSDVLILVRGNDTAAELAEILGASRIPVITENGLLLSENALIIQSIAFLSFLANPADDIAFWTVLTGSIFSGHPLSASLGDLSGWAAGRAMSGPLWRQFRQDFPEIWKATFGLFLGKPSLMTAYDTVMEWYRRLDVSQRFAKDETMLRRFMETLHLAESSGMVSISAFLEYWREQGQEEKAPMPANMNAVRIMTIHKSKGLEAPVVIVPCPDYGIKASEDLSVLRVGDVEVAVRLTQAMGRPYYEDMARQALEALNLVYVAFTRPREELYLVYPDAKIGTAKNTRDAMEIMLAAADLKIGYKSGTRCAPKPGHKLELAAPEEQPVAAAGMPDPDWLPMDWLPRLRIYRAEPVARKLSAKQRGTVMHACLEFMDAGGEPWQNAAIALKNGINSCGIAVPESERAGIQEALVWFAENAPGRDWLVNGSREQPLVSAEGEILRADLIVRYPWGTLVVDYKSGEPAPEHISQIRNYMRVLAQSDGASGRVRGLLVYLDKRAFMKVSLKDNIDLAKPPVFAAPRLEPELPVLP